LCGALYLIGIFLLPFPVFAAAAGVMVALIPAAQRREGDSAVALLPLLLCFGSLLVGGYVAWFLRLVRNDRIAVFTVYDNGLSYGTTADAFTMRLSVKHGAVIPWGDIAELHEHGSRSGLRVLLPHRGRLLIQERVALRQR
jgi:hypothetical protein